MAFKFKEEDQTGFKFRAEDTFKFRPEDKPSSFGEGKATSISQGPTMGDRVVEMFQPFIAGAKGALAPLPGTQAVTRALTAPIRATTGMLKTATSGGYGPTVEALSSPLKTAANVADFIGEGISEGGVSPLDVFTLGAGKFARAGDIAVEGAAKIAFQNEAKAAAAAALTQKKVETNALKKYPTLQKEFELRDKKIHFE